MGAYDLIERVYEGEAPEHVCWEVEDVFLEGVYDPAIFKAVFVVAGPAAGKSFVIKEVGLREMGMKYISSDVFLEMLLRKVGKGFDLDKEDYGQERETAKGITGRQQANYLEGRLGIIKESTLSRIAHTKRAILEIKSLGYDISLLYIQTDVETAVRRNAERSRNVSLKVVKSLHRELSSKIPSIIRLFPSADVHKIVNADSTGRDKAIFQKGLAQAASKLRKWAKEPPKSAEAKKWIANELEMRRR